MVNLEADILAKYIEKLTKGAAQLTHWRSLVTLRPHSCYQFLNN